MNSMVRITDRPDMTSAVYRGCKGIKQNNSLICGAVVSNLRKNVRLILVNCLWDGLPNSVVRITDRISAVYRGRKAINQRKHVLNCRKNSFHLDLVTQKPFNLLGLKPV